MHGAVIVGGGVAASEAAFAMRRNGFAGPLSIVTEEAHWPYQRPPLSKAYLAGEVGLGALYTRPAAAYEKAGITVASSTRVEAIDRTGKQVALSDRRVLRYDKLLLAVGGRARALNDAPADVGNLHAIRTIADVDRLRPQLVPGARMVIIGGGYLGLEFASVGIKLGLKVCVLESMPRVLARVAAPQVSSFFEQVHRQSGVDVRTGVQVSGFETETGGRRIRSVVCADGEALRADVVVAGVGMVPNTELAQAAGVVVADGIVVDAASRTSDADIFAIGDCANAPLPGGERARLESVPNALDQARIAAAAICAKDLPRRNVPWFWSDQYDLKLQIAGMSRGHDATLVRGSIAARRFSVLYLKGGRLIAADTVNWPADFAAARALISQERVVDMERIADGSVALSALAA